MIIGLLNAKSSIPSNKRVVWNFKIKRWQIKPLFVTKSNQHPD